MKEILIDGLDELNYPFLKGARVSYRYSIIGDYIEWILTPKNTKFPIGSTIGKIPASRCFSLGRSGLRYVILEEISKVIGSHYKKKETDSLLNILQKIL